MSQIRGEVSDEERGFVEKYCREKHSGLERAGKLGTRTTPHHMPHAVAF